MFVGGGCLTNADDDTGQLLPGNQRLARLFPRALRAPGWKHMWDNVLRRSVSQLQWWPLFLRRLKALVYLLREEDFRKALVRLLRRQGKGGLAEAIHALRVPNFAKWRWGTLTIICLELSRIIGSLMDNFDPGAFVWVQDSGANS